MPTANKIQQLLKDIELWRAYLEHNESVLQLSTASKGVKDGLHRVVLAIRDLEFQVFKLNKIING